MPKPSRKDIAAIVALLPAMEAADYEFGHYDPMRQDEKGYWIWPAFRTPELTKQWIQALWDHHMVDCEFDAGSWGMEAKRYGEHPEAVALADFTTIRQLLTYHIRADRFVEGHLLGAWCNGHLLAVMRRLAELHEGGACPPARPVRK